MSKILIKNARIVNEGAVTEGDIFIENERITQVGGTISQRDNETQVIDAAGKFLLPGIIDDQVHFREPGLTHKADIQSESRAAVAGGVTSFIEQPNTRPPATTIDLLEEKYARAAQVSLANFGFNLGASNDNLEEIKKADPRKIPGVKVFMGSSTGNMLVDAESTLDGIFKHSPLPIITHCEDEDTIRENLERYKAEYGDDIPIKYHPDIRSREACLLSSKKAVALAEKHNSRLHIYHISTAEETELFTNKVPLAEKRITAEACIHHLWFNSDDYDEKGTLIKWNPAVKKESDRSAIFEALLDDRIDVIATDHAPHTLDEKSQVYTKAPSGGPLLQHALLAMMEFVRDEKISIERLVEKMCHNPAILFDIKERGYIREGYYADLVLVDAAQPWKVNRENILSKCGWSPFEGTTFRARISHTLVNGKIAYDNGRVNDKVLGKRLEFDR
jgi:dihydroorotase